MRSRSHHLTFLAVSAALWATFAVPASALTLQAPAAALDSVDATVSLGSEDPTGTVWVLVDGAVAVSRLAAPGSTLEFPDVVVGKGTRVLRAAVKHRSGVVYSEPVTVTVWGVPARPVLVEPSGGYTAGTSMISAKAGAWTTNVTLHVNGVRVRTLNMIEGQRGWFGTRSFPAGTSTIVLQSANPLASRSYSYSVKRLDFPWATCIIIDQSEFRLYWVRNGSLVRIYPIAHGKPSTPTPNRVWKILAKYQTSPGSVYGPRKMRLFKQTSSGYVYTAYGIHGTNQPWVIGTRASHGCIRMCNKDVLELWPQVPLGTMVQTRP